MENNPQSVIGKIKSYDVANVSFGDLEDEHKRETMQEMCRLSSTKMHLVTLDKAAVIKGHVYQAGTMLVIDAVTNALKAVIEEVKDNNTAV